MRLLTPVLLLSWSATAAAQIAPGSSGSSTSYSFGGQLAWDELGVFGKCYASMQRKDALTLVATRPGSMEELKTYKQLFRKPYQSCLGTVTKLAVSPLAVRGAIAEGLYHQKVPVPPNLVVATGPTRERVSNFGEAAICYTARHRVAVQSLVDQTRPGTEKEANAVVALLPGFSECIPPGAAKSLQLDATLIRFRLAEALWRLGVSPGQAKAETAE